jgi:hypothetical protein
MSTFTSFLFAGAAVAQMNPDALSALNNADWSDILKSQQPDETWAPSSVYKSPDLIAAVEKMTNQGIGEYKLMGGLSDTEGNYALVNLAAMLAQSMHETIQYDACDENNWDQTSGYTASNACGQLGQSYQDYKCPAGEEHMACENDPEMEMVASTNAKWYGAPGPMFCAPKSKVPKAPRWDHSQGWCNPAEEYPKIEGDDFWAAVTGNRGDDQCGVYEGQKAGGWTHCEGAGCANAEAPIFGQPARTDVEGCCWWGRGVIQTTGVCNFGKLNYFAGARAAREGRESLFPNVDFCKRPDSICNSTEHPDLKWVAGLFFYSKEVQLYPTDDKWSFDYDSELKYFTDAGDINDRSFIDKVSGIVNRGCPSLNACAAGPTHEAHKRAENFKTVLRAFGYPFDGTAPISTTQTPVTTQGQNSTNGDAPIAGEACSSSCSDCRHNTNHTQSANDAACAPCATGQSWWPCNVENLCYCADSNETEAPSTTTEAPATTEAPVTTETPTTEAPTTQAPSTTEATTTAAPTTTEAATTEAPATTTASQTTTKYTTKDCTQTTQAPTTEEPTTDAPTTQQPTTEEPSAPAGGECDASCVECVAVPGNAQAAIDMHCVACGGDTMQSWWPCAEPTPICKCKTRRNILV